jgi:hypothetical protein
VAQQHVEGPTEAAVQPPAEAEAAVQPPAEAEAAVQPPAEAERFVRTSAHAAKPAVFTRIARPVPSEAIRDAASVPSIDPPTERAAFLPVAPAARTTRPAGSGPAAGEVVVIVGHVDVILPEVTALLRRWKVPTVTEAATQACLSHAMDSAHGLVVTGPTPGSLGPDQLDGQRWAHWRNADVPVVVLIPTAALTGAGSRQLARRLVALGADRVLAAVDARDETENLRHWLRGFPGVQGLLAHHVGAARNPTDVAQLGLPVVALDGRSATAARWRTYFRSTSPHTGRAVITAQAHRQRRVGAR